MIAYFMEWDWRRFARACAWLALGVHFGYVTQDLVSYLARQFILGGLTLGPLYLYPVCGLIRLGLWLEDAAFDLAEWLTRPAKRSAPFALAFLVDFAAELALVVTFGAWWQWAGMTARLAGWIEAALMAAVRAVSL